MEDFQALRIFNKLKSVYRFNSVDNRKESVAEHTSGCLFLADYFLSTSVKGLDRVKVYELLMYHDVVEIESGDVSLIEESKYFDKREKEHLAASILKTQIPAPLNEKFIALFEDFERGISEESYFARAIDALEAEIHELDYKKDWVGWTKQKLLELKEYRFERFPEMAEMFEKIVQFLEQNHYFDETIEIPSS